MDTHLGSGAGSAPPFPDQPPKSIDEGAGTTLQDHLNIEREIERRVYKMNAYAMAEEYRDLASLDPQNDALEPPDDMLDETDNEAWGRRFQDWKEEVSLALKKASAIKEPPGEASDEWSQWYRDVAIVKASFGYKILQRLDDEAVPEDPRRPQKAEYKGQLRTSIGGWKVRISEELTKLLLKRYYTRYTSSPPGSQPPLADSSKPLERYPTISGASSETPSDVLTDDPLDHSGSSDGPSEDPPEDPSGDASDSHSGEPVDSPPGLSDWYAEARGRASASEARRLQVNQDLLDGVFNDDSYKWLLSRGLVTEELRQPSVEDEDFIPKFHEFYNAVTEKYIQNRYATAPAYAAGPYELAAQWPAHSVDPIAAALELVLGEIVYDAGDRMMIVVDGQSVLKSSKDRSLVDPGSILLAFSRANRESYVVVVHRDKLNRGTRVREERIECTGAGAIVFARARYNTEQDTSGPVSVCRQRHSKDESTHDKCRSDDLMLHWIAVLARNKGVGRLVIVSNNRCYDTTAAWSRWASPGMIDIPSFVADICLGRVIDRNDERFSAVDPLVFKWIGYNSDDQVYRYVVNPECIAYIFQYARSFYPDRHSWGFITADDAIKYGCDINNRVAVRYQ